MTKLRVASRTGRTVGLIVVALIGIIAPIAVPSPGVLASTAPDDPAEYLNATETGGTQEEIDY